ncbi:MAG TPA: hypothetical protein QF753_15185 [Victivallales bacterium]|nr:hypothetical protein [Victivallales bacterium]
MNHNDLKNRTKLFALQVISMMSLLFIKSLGKVIGNQLFPGRTFLFETAKI